ncbi:hypothetical protein ABTY20_24930 [Streptomyces sp. NPDC126497]|uniref:hypothetical protein n=1 Tax=Streptomyces sp. NPDC126497 TaxID=3155313 RepID=UPI00331E2B21
MIEESVLLESRTLRQSVSGRTDVLDRVKALSLLPDGMRVTTAMVAAYFDVTHRGDPSAQGAAPRGAGPQRNDNAPRP